MFIISAQVFFSDLVDLNPLKGIFQGEDTHFHVLLSKDIFDAQTHIFNFVKKKSQPNT